MYSNSKAIEAHFGGCSIVQPEASCPTLATISAALHADKSLLRQPEVNFRRLRVLTPGIDTRDELESSPFFR